MASNLSVLHRSCLRSLLGVSRKVRNKVVHLLAAQPSTQLKFVKQMFRYCKRLESNYRVATDVFKWAGTTVEKDGKLTIKKMLRIVEAFGSV